MTQTPTGVVVEAQQTDEKARQDFARLLSAVSNGEVRGSILDNGHSSQEVVGPGRVNPVRRGAMWGATVGFLVGLIPLMASAIAGALVGSLVMKALELRLEPGSAPRIRFSRDKS